MGLPFLSRRAYELLDVGAIIVPILAIRDVFGSARHTWRSVPEWMKFLEFIMLYYAAFAFLLPHHPSPDRRVSAPIHDISYQLPAYFGAIEVLYARLRNDPTTDDYLQRGLGAGVKIG